MNSREKMLVALVAGVVLLFGAKFAYDQIAGMFDENDKAVADINKKIDKSSADIAAGKKAAQRIAEWERRSLPSDRVQAPVKYNDWLVQLVSKHGFRGKDVHPVGMVGLATNTAALGYEKFGFEVKGLTDITCKPLVDFLYEFYASNQLHKIKTLEFRPTSDSQLEVTMTVEAMLLPGATGSDGKPRREKLSDVPPKTLTLGNVAAYEKSIAGRNFFKAYEPPVVVDTSRGRTNPPPNTSPPFDYAKYTKLTGIVTENDVPEIFVSVQPTGDKFNGLKVGDEFTVGGVTYKVASIGTRNAVLTTEGKRKQIEFGGTLHDAIDLPEEPGL
jgi:hypothetical protein